MSPEDTKLANYMLGELRADSGRMEDKIDAMGAAVTTLTNQVTVLSAESSAHMREDARRFNDLDRRLDKIDTNVGDTGKHKLDEVKAHLAASQAAKAEVEAELAATLAEAAGRASEAAKEKRLFRAKIIAGVVIALASAGISAGISHVLTRGATPANAATK